jgi:adenosylcobinamide-phosphate guanylyltransferase
MTSEYIEKPLIKVGNVPMIERVISALEDSHKFDQIIAVVSPNSPKTKEVMKLKGIDIIETTGNGFSQDLAFLSEFSPAKVLVIPADIPLLNPKIVEEIVGNITKTSAGAESAAAISIAIEKEFVESIGIKPSVVIEERSNNNNNLYCHSGITIFDTAKIALNSSRGSRDNIIRSNNNSYLKEQYKIMNKVEVAVNVNTKEELELAEKLLLLV